MKRGYYFIFSILILVFGACKKDFEGELKTNKAPETYTVADTIFREGENRFPSSLEVKWWGEDPDGYISGYEISGDGINWIFTKRQDTTFIVEIPAGKDTFDFKISTDSLDAPIAYEAEDSMVLDVPSKKITLYGKETKTNYKDISKTFRSYCHIRI